MIFSLQNKGSQQQDSWPQNSCTVIKIIFSQMILRISCKGIHNKLFLCATAQDIQTGYQGG